MKQTLKYQSLPCVTNGLVQDTPTVGIPASLITSPAPIEGVEEYEPIIAATLSFSINLETALAASTFSDLLSAITSSTFLPNTSLLSA